MAVLEAAVPSLVGDLIRIGATAILGGVAVNITASQWQHRNWRLQRLTSLQEQAYRDAQAAMIEAMSRFDVPLTVLKAACVADPPLPGAREEVVKAMAAVGGTADVPTLYLEIQRLFAPPASAAAGDAGAAVRDVHKCAVAALSGYVERGETPDFDGLDAARANAILRIRGALSIVAKHIGRSPEWRWWQRIGRSKPKFGQRATDKPADFGRIVARSSKASGPRRRHTDKVWDELRKERGA